MSDSSSVGSNRSLRSHGSRGLDDLMGSQDNTTSRKAATHWELDEEKDLIAFLSTRKSEAGDTMSFKAHIFTEAAKHLNTTYPNPKGAPKSQSSCKTKWTAVSFIIKHLFITAAHIITA